MFLRASELNPRFKKITTGESITSFISCAKKYFEDEGTGTKQLQFFWCNAARYGCVDVMEWAHKQGRGYSANWGQLGCFHNIGASACGRAAAKDGQLQVLWRLKQRGFDWAMKTYRCHYAALGGHLHIVKWARENDCHWGNTCCNATKGGHLHIIKWAIENGCDWGDTCHAAAAAALGGHLHIVKWVRENGCDWGDICRAAALGGHLHILQWARENGCP